ncbi:MAG: LuxR C-terminal-related transcriptional regulator [Chloroflexi bacterium]|nr:LuxR C-terminal-related transcriptional regulator [Chloroflexota bacterium]
MRSLKTSGLSCRQVEILRKVAEGMSNKEIAGQLHVSDQTVKNHMTHILDKLYANDRTHAVVLAYRLGLLDLEGGRAAA